MKKLIKYLITLLVGFALVTLIIWSNGIFSKTSPLDIFRILTDGFFAVGFVMAGFGLLIFTSNEGVFLGLIYSVSSFFSMFKKDMKRKYDTFYDYKMSKEKKKLEFGFMLICGLLFLAVSFVMYILYSQYI